MVVDLAYADRLAALTLQSRAWWAAAALLTLLALLLSTRSAVSRRRAAATLSRLRELSRADSATASIEYLLVFFPFLIIVLTVWQLAFMFNAQLQVGYAAYAAARSASVWVPAESDKEPAGVIKSEDEVPRGKWLRIRRAAIPGTLAISPGDISTGVRVFFDFQTKQLVTGGEPISGGDIVPDAQAVVPRLTLMTAHYGGLPLREGSRAQRALFKTAYANGMTRVSINAMDHTKTQMNLNASETLTVTVDYVYWLHVPYVGRLIEAAFAGWINPLSGDAVRYPSMVLSETLTMTNWRRKCAMSKYCP